MYYITQYTKQHSLLRYLQECKAVQEEQVKCKQNLYLQYMEQAFLILQHKQLEFHHHH